MSDSLPRCLANVKSQGFIQMIVGDGLSFDASLEVFGGEDFALDTCGLSLIVRIRHSP